MYTIIGVESQVWKMVNKIFLNQCQSIISLLTSAQQFDIQITHCQYTRSSHFALCKPI